MHALHAGACDACGSAVTPLVASAGFACNLFAPHAACMLRMRDAMQAFHLTKEAPAYTPAMQTGRPAKKERTAFGQRLHALREQAGLSQQQLADRIGLTQRAYAYWERHPVALRPDQLLKVAEA